MNLVEQLYESIPEFGEINDSFFVEFDYTVYGNFGVFLEDLAQINSYGKIVDQHYYGDFDLESRFLGIDLGLLISKSFEFIESIYTQGNDHTRDVINASFFKIVITSVILNEYAAKCMSPGLNRKMNDMWRAFK